MVGWGWVGGRHLGLIDSPVHALAAGINNNKASLLTAGCWDVWLVSSHGGRGCWELRWELSSVGCEGIPNSGSIH